MLINAELTRQLRTEVNWQRLLFVPAVALLILYLLRVEEEGDADYRFWFFASAAGWGSFSVIWSVKEAFNNRTWLWQQLLPLSPRQLLVGILLGVLALPWFAGLLLLSPLITSAQALESVLFAACINAAALFLVLITVRGGKANMAVALIATLGAVTYLFGLPTGSAVEDLIVWHNFIFPAQPFLWVSLAVYLCWALAGCHTLLAAAKRARNWPWLAPLFFLYNIVFISGLAFDKMTFDLTPEESLVALYSILTWLVLWCTLYASAFLCGSEGLPLFIDNLRRAVRGGGGGIRPLWQTLPAWLWPLAGMVLVAIVVFVLVDNHNAWLVVAMTLFALRDISILLLFTLRRGGHLPEGIALVILSTLYIPLPYALDAIGVGGHLLSPDISPYGIANNPEPFELSEYYTATISAAAQSAVAISLLWRYRLVRLWER